MYSLCFLSLSRPAPGLKTRPLSGPSETRNDSDGDGESGGGAAENLYNTVLKTSRQYGSFVLRRLAAAGPRRGAIETGDPDMRDRDTRGPAPAAETHARVRGARGRRRATASAPSLAYPGLRATMPREHLEARVTPAKASLRLTRITTG